MRVSQILKKLRKYWPNIFQSLLILSFFRLSFHFEGSGGHCHLPHAQDKWDQGIPQEEICKPQPTLGIPHWRESIPQVSLNFWHWLTTEEAIKYLAHLGLCGLKFCCIFWLKLQPQRRFIKTRKLTRLRRRIGLQVKLGRGEREREMNSWLGEKSRN